MEKQTTLASTASEETKRQDNLNQPAVNHDKESAERSGYGKKMREKIAERKKKFYTKK